MVVTREDCTAPDGFAGTDGLMPKTLTELRATSHSGQDMVRLLADFSKADGWILSPSATKKSTSSLPNLGSNWRERHAAQVPSLDTCVRSAQMLLPTKQLFAFEHTGIYAARF
jgi:hypothetical protein